MAIELGSTGINKLYLGSTEINKAYLGSTVVYEISGGGVTYDADAEAYFNAVISQGVSVSDPQKLLLSNFYESLKTDSIYTKINTMYFWPWGDANGNKFNMKDPDDDDASFRATFTGSPTHGSGGITFNGTTQYADLKILNSTVNRDANSLGVYVSSSSNNNCWYIGCRSTSGTTTNFFIGRGSSASQTQFASNNNGNTQAAVTADGLLHCTRTGPKVTAMYRNGSSIGSNTTGSLTGFNHAVYVGAGNDNGSSANFFANATILFAFVGGSMTSTDAANLNTHFTTLRTGWGL